MVRRQDDAPLRIFFHIEIPNDLIRLYPRCPDDGVGLDRVVMIVDTPSSGQRGYSRIKSFGISMWKKIRKGASS